HRERGLHAGEKQDHANEPGRDVDLVEHVGLVGWDDRHAEHLAEAGGENEEPEQRPHQRRDETFALVEEAQPFADQDALQAAEIAPDAEGRHVQRLRGICCRLGSGRAHAASSAAAVARLGLSFEKASPMFFVSVERTISATPALATRLPSTSTTAW